MKRGENIKGASFDASIWGKIIFRIMQVGHQVPLKGEGKQGISRQSAFFKNPLCISQKRRKLTGASRVFCCWWWRLPSLLGLDELLPKSPLERQ